MNNFTRALRLTLRHRLTFVASVICALGVAVMWGGSLTAIYPFISIALEGKSLQDWAVHSVALSEERITTLQGDIKKVDEQLERDKAAPETQEAKALKKLNSERLYKEQQLLAEERALARTQWLEKNIIVPYLPNDAFLTIVIVSGLLLLSTILKCLLLIANSVLVSRMTQLAVFDLSKKFYRHTLRMDLAHFSAEGSSDLMSRFTYDTECLANGLRELFGKFVREPLKMIACLAGAAWISWQLLLLSLLLAPGGRHFHQCLVEGA